VQPSALALKVKGQGQRSSSNTTTFTRLIEPIALYCFLKLHQHLTSSFQVIGNF